MADNMTREQWGRIEYLAVMLAGGFQAWDYCTSNQRSAYRALAAQLLIALEDGESCADWIDALGISKYEI
jgi:hypothetical protein